MHFLAVQRFECLVASSDCGEKVSSMFLSETAISCVMLYFARSIRKLIYSTIAICLLIHVTSCPTLLHAVNGRLVVSRDPDESMI